MPKTELACGTSYDLYDFGGSRKGIENGGQKGSKTKPNIDILALWGSIFEILGGFWRGLIFDVFLSGKISAKIQKIDHGGPHLTPSAADFLVLTGFLLAEGEGGSGT